MLRMAAVRRDVEKKSNRVEVAATFETPSRRVTATDVDLAGLAELLNFGPITAWEKKSGLPLFPLSFPHLPGFQGTIPPKEADVIR